MRAQVDGNRPKEVVFKEIDSLLSQVEKDKEKHAKLGTPFSRLEIHQLSLAQIKQLLPLT